MELKVGDKVRIKYDLIKWQCLTCGEIYTFWKNLKNLNKRIVTVINVSKKPDGFRFFCCQNFHNIDSEYSLDLAFEAKNVGLVEIPYIFVEKIENTAKRRIVLWNSK